MPTRDLFSGFDDEPQEPDSPQILSVWELTSRIKDLLEVSFPTIWVSGEISNLSRPQSGHCYLTLKDQRAQLKAAIWRNAAARLRFDLHDGLEVVCRGHIDVYAPRGTYQLIIEEVEPKGMGALELALRQLRDRLGREGLFDAAHKRPLPEFVRQIAVVTSPTGAAIHDFLQVLGRRWRGADVLILPTRVQGEGAAEEIAAAIAILADARRVVGAARQADVALPEADLSADIRAEFEIVTSAGEMAVLRTQAERSRNDARSVGDALDSLRSLVPGWTLPPVVSGPVETRDFAAAALSAAAAQKWVEDAWLADQKLPELIGALDRTKPAFESAATMADLRAGGALAENWATASARVANAVEVEREERSLLAQFGLFDVNVQPTLDAAIAAAIDGDVPLATAKSAEVIEVIRGGSGAGGLRLAGIVLFGIAVIGLLGLWWLLRRQAGPAWARQTTPHWIEDRKTMLPKNKKDKP